MHPHLHICKHRREHRETFIPLEHDPGQRLEADFGHIYVDFPDGRWRNTTYLKSPGDSCKSAGMAKLSLIHGPGAGKVFALEGCPLTIGRKDCVSIRLDLAAVSRQHARITCENARYFVEDLGSSNGTCLNGYLLKAKTELHHEDRITIGPFEFLFENPLSELTVLERTQGWTQGWEEFIRHDEGDTYLTDWLAPPQADDECGRLGGYRILKVLGHGGMGVVFEGEDPRLGRRVAIKAMLPYLAQRLDPDARFLREVRAVATLKHDHVVPIFHVGIDRGATFMVMPFLKGEPLDRHLAREEKLPMAEVLRIGREIAKGLGAAHMAGLIHRDIKPANIWLEAPDKRVVILDFGLVKLKYYKKEELPSSVEPSLVLGTPAYMAPEQIPPRKFVDERCDLWSLGVVLYGMCTGMNPFKQHNIDATLKAVLAEHPHPPAEINAAIPAGLSDLVMKLLEKDAAKRIASADAVVDALRNLELGLQAT